MSKRKYHDQPDVSDVQAALTDLGTNAHAQISITMRPSLQSATSLIVRVEFRAMGLEMAADPVHVYQEAFDTRRKVEMASVLHRIVQAAWASYHGTPWAWTGGMRRAHVRSEA